MDPADLFGARQIRDSSGDAKHAMEPVGRQPHRRSRIGEQLAARLVGGPNRIEQFAIGLGVGPHPCPVVTPRLEIAGGRYAERDFSAPLGRRRQGQIRRRNARHLDVEVDAVP